MYILKSGHFSDVNFGNQELAVVMESVLSELIHYWKRFPSPPFSSFERNSLRNLLSHFADSAPP